LIGARDLLSIHGDKLHALHADFDHAVHGVPAATADANHFQHGLHF
jgi:hypothetical protein